MIMLLLKFILLYFLFMFLFFVLRNLIVFKKIIQVIRAARRMNTAGHASPQNTTKRKQKREKKEVIIEDVSYRDV